MISLRSFLVLLAVVPCASAADWPQWLGPTRDGVSPEKVAPWTDAPKVLWRQPVGEGNSSPILANGRLFLHSKTKDKNEEEVVARDAQTGKEIWRQTYPRAAFTSLYGNGPRATPAVVDGRLFTFGITGVLTCWDAATGTRHWQVETLTTFGAKNLFFGASCSPLVEGNTVLVNVGGKGASVVALDTASGKTVWKALDDPASYSSPIVFGEGKERQVVFLTQLGVVSLSPKDGQLHWRFPLKDSLLESSTTPARAGETVLASSITYGSAGLKVGSTGGKPEMSEQWKNPALTSYFSTPVALGPGNFLLVTGTNPLIKLGAAQADLHCVDARTGRSLWKKEKVGQFHASLLRLGDGNLLMLEDTGYLVLFAGESQAYRELVRAKVCGSTWAHPALADGRLYLRDEKEILCLQVGP